MKYTVEWTDHEGNLQQRTFNTLEEAQTEAEFLQDIYDHVNIRPDALLRGNRTTCPKNILY